MTRNRYAWIAVIAVSVAALGSSIAWGVASSGGHGGTGGDGAGMAGPPAARGGDPVTHPAHIRAHGSSAAMAGASQARRPARLHVGPGGKIGGMPSVKVSSGGVRYHSWHGRSMAMGG